MRPRVRVLTEVDIGEVPPPEAVNHSWPSHCCCCSVQSIVDRLREAGVDSETPQGYQRQYKGKYRHLQGRPPDSWGIYDVNA